MGGIFLRFCYTSAGSILCSLSNHRYRKLDFQLFEDTKLSENKRWVLIAPTGAKECCLLLAKAANNKQMASIGNHTGGRVFMFLFTDDFWRNFNKMLDRNINFVRPPTEENYGLVAVFENLYGNLWDLLTGMALKC
ncbi:MAG: VOC family protein [Puia sp.]